MFKKLTRGCVKLVQKYLPDPFLFAVILTLIVLIMGITMTGQSLMAMLGHWNNGFWSLLAFAMQMTLVLVTGHTLANAPIIRRALNRMAKATKTPLQAIVAVTFVSLIACWINWGFGLVVGALYARQLAKEVKKVDYRLLIASAYSGFLIWHAGISGSIPLKLATAGEGLSAATLGAVVDPISTSQTIFAPFNLIICAIILVTLPFLNRAMHPAEEDVIAIDPSLLIEPEPVVVSKENMTPADRLENSPVLSMIIGAMGLAVIFVYFSNGGSLNLNIVNFIFLFAGVILLGTPRRFLNAVF